LGNPVRSCARLYGPNAETVQDRQFIRDYEQLTAVTETLIMIAATATLIRRWP